MKEIIARFLLLVTLLFSCSCSESGIGEFQKNVPDPDFILFDMFKNEPALDEFWDVLDQRELNRKMAEMIKANKEDFVIFSRINMNIMAAEGSSRILPPMMKDVRGMLGIMKSTENRFMDTQKQGSFYENTPSEYRRVMYALSDRLRRDTSDKELTDSILAMARKVTQYMTDKKNAKQLQADMSDLVKSINDLERDDFILLTKNIGKVMAAASYPMYIRTPEFSTAGDGKFGILETDYNVMTDFTDSGLGNAVKGNHALLTGLRDRIGGKISDADRDLVYDLISDLRNSLLDEDNSPVIKDFIITLEKYFTVGGSVYGTAADTSNTNVNSNIYNTNSPNLYSDTELTNTLKETLGAQLGLLLRDDRSGALTFDKDSKSYALERFARRLRDTGIDWKNAKLEESLFDTLVVDPYGRDRRNVKGFDGRKPYAISFLEDFFFLGGITNNFGWKHGGSKNEIGGSSDFKDVCNLHGHGEPTNFITLNDSLFSITSSRTLGNGTYELALALPERADHIFRSKNSFAFSKDNSRARDPYKFYYDPNYCALDFVTGGAVGDLGLPADYNGGNVNGVNPGLNGYRPYNGNGIDEKALAAWTLGWVARACFEGEGPYYYADPAAPLQMIDGKSYKKYMRPNGRVYAYVHYNGGTPDEYIYAAEGDDPVDSVMPGSVEQRENRYKSTWQTDYYMITNQNGDKCYTPKTMDGTATRAEALTYNELIGEYETVRECKSQEEAIFRNYQWVMTEKKFVIVIPMWIRNELLVIESAVFQIVEGHGFAGCAIARKYRGNRVWAKANIAGDSYDPAHPTVIGGSKIPGDYRIDLKAKVIQSFLAAVDEDKIYEDTLGFGPATYSAVFHALAPLYRLGFPRSPLFDESAYATGYGATGAMNFEHYQLGSRQFSASDSDPIWQKRNMILPLLGALINVLHESGTPLNKTVANFTDGTLPLLKPLFFYNENIRDGVCSKSLLPRVNGGATVNSYNYPHSMALIPEQFITGFKGKGFAGENDPDAWFGGWDVRNYYMAAPMTTLFSSLIDRTGIEPGKPDSNRKERAGGILPLLTEYDITRERSVTNQSPTRIVSNLVDQLVKLSDSSYDDKSKICYTGSDFDNRQYANWGARRRILYGLEQMMSAGKMAKTRYISILQDLSKGSDVAKGGTASKMQRIPEWIFQQRDVDIDMNEILARVIGFDDPDGAGPLKGKGLAGGYQNSEGAFDWIDFDDDREDLALVIDNLLLKNAKYNITGDMLDAADIFMSKNITDDEIASVMYTSGKLFAWHNESRWVWQGESAGDTPDKPETDFAFMWRLTKNYLPLIHQKISPDDKDPAGGKKYMAMLKVLSTTLKEDGLVPFVMDTTLSADTEQLVDDIYEFLGEDFVIGGGAMWTTLADLMKDLAENVENTTPETVSDIYSSYGFQNNGY